MLIVELLTLMVVQKVYIRAGLLEFRDPLMKNRQLNMKTRAAIWKLMAELHTFTLLYPLLKIR
jgi:hypothetical protein